MIEHLTVLWVGSENFDECLLHYVRLILDPKLVTGWLQPSSEDFLEKYCYLLSA